MKRVKRFDGFKPIGKRIKIQGEVEIQTPYIHTSPHDIVLEALFFRLLTAERRGR